MSNTDLRVIKSKKNIRTAFLDIMKEKDYKDITVKDIAEKAMINRKTFYFHYETKDALYREIAQEVASLIKPIELISHIQNSTREGQRKILCHFLMGLKENKDICTIFMNSTDGYLANLIKAQLADVLLSKTEIIKRTKGTGLSFDFLLDTYFAVFQIILKWWVQSDETDPEKALNIFFRMFSREPLELLGIRY